MLTRQTGGQRFIKSGRLIWWNSRAYIISILATLSLTSLLLWIGSQPPTNQDTVVYLSIPEGATRQDVADRLRGLDMIRSRTVFNIIVHVGYEGRPFVAGTYKLRKNLHLFEVLRILEGGLLSTEQVTIPEGFNVRKIAARLGARKVTSEEKLEKMALTSAKEFGIDSPTKSLEGYLFPDTYQFHLGLQPEDVLLEMVETFNRQVTRPLEDKIIRSGYTLHEIVTIASLIEKEARTPEDRPLIASVIHNRLKAGMPLQIDATVIYALGRHKSRVMYADLNEKSPYNTYRRRGLPPGPIASPGLASIHAALEPAQTNYLYYVAKPDGSHLFASTFEQHKANRKKVRGL